MSSFVALPDGSHVEIPAGTSPDKLAQFKDVLRQKYPAQDITNPQEMAARGPGAPGAAPLPQMKTVGRTPLAAQAQTPEQRTFQEEHVLPAIQQADEIGGAMVPLGGEVAAPGLLGRVGMGALKGAGAGALEQGIHTMYTGHLPSLGEAGTAVGTGAVLGGVTGGVMPKGILGRLSRLAGIGDKAPEAAQAIEASEGRPATWTNEEVVEMAKRGEPRASIQRTLRGLDPHIEIPESYPGPRMKVKY